MFSRTVVASDLLGKVDRSLLSRLTVLMYDFRHFLVVDVLRSLLLNVNRISSELAHFVVKPRHMFIQPCHGVVFLRAVVEESHLISEVIAGDAALADQI